MSEEGLEFMETIRGNYRRREVATDWAMFLRDRRGHRYCTKSSRWIIETTLQTSCTNANMMKCR